MVLPVELQPYAENLYRRFPEEFIALGMPGLEEVFDLRPRGTWSRRIAETPSEKTVEITIRRWTPGTVAAAAGAIGGPSSLGQHQVAPGFYPQNFGGGYFLGGSAGYPHHQQLGHPQTAYLQQLHQLQQQQLAAASVGLAGAVGTGLSSLGLPPSMQSFGQSPPPPHPAAAAPGFSDSHGLVAPAPQQAPAAPPLQATPAGLDEQTTQRLSRMESALTMLKPQIEAVLAGQAQAKKQAAGGTSSADHAAGAQSPGGIGGGAEQAAGQQRGQGQAGTEPVNTDLRNRRNLGRMQLQINTSPDDRPRPQTTTTQSVTMVAAAAANPSMAGGADVAAAGAASPAVVAIPRSQSEGSSLVAQGNAAGVERRRPGGVSTVRVAPSFMDPASPRSPGFYSAWK